MALLITLVPNTAEGVDAFAAALRTELLGASPALTTADAVSRYVSGKGNPRVRPNTTDDHAVDVEMRLLGGDWTTILSVRV